MGNGLPRRGRRLERIQVSEVSSKFKNIQKKIAIKMAPQVLAHAQQQVDMAVRAIGIAEDRTAKLAGVLSFMLANGNGEVSFPGSALAMLPKDAVLHEEYDDANDVYTFRVAVPKRPKIEVVPSIEATTAAFAAQAFGTAAPTPNVQEGLRLVK